VALTSRSLSLVAAYNASELNATVPSLVVAASNASSYRPRLTPTNTPNLPQRLAPNATGQPRHSVGVQGLPRLDPKQSQATGIKVHVHTHPLSKHWLPQNLFAFWYSDKLSHFPAVVRDCLALMANKNPGWALTVLDNTSFLDMPNVNPDDPMMAQHIADWVRLAAIARYGGVYFDSTVISLKAIEHTFDPTFDGLQGFTLGVGSAFTNDTIGAMLGNEQMENFAFAAPPGNPLVVAWLQEYTKALNMGLENYSKTVNPAIVGDVIMRQLPYITAYACFRVARYGLPNEPLRLSQVTGCEINNALQWACGPYHFLENPIDVAVGGLNETIQGSLYATEALFRSDKEKLQTSPIIKLRGGERMILEEYPQIYTSGNSYLGNLMVAAPIYARTTACEQNVS